MSALPKPQPEAFRPPERELSILEHMERIARKAEPSIQQDVQAVMAYLTAQEMEKGLKAAIQKDDLARIRDEAVNTLKANATGWREEVRKDLVTHIIYGLQCGANITRGELKEKAASICAYRNFKGKNRQRIQDSVIGRWLTLEREQYIRTEAARINADSASKGNNRT